MKKQNENEYCASHLWGDLRKDRKLCLKHIRIIEESNWSEDTNKEREESWNILSDNWQALIYLLQHYPFRIHEAGFGPDWINEYIWTEMEDWIKDKQGEFGEFISELFKLGYYENGEVIWHDDHYSYTTEPGPTCRLWSDRIKTWNTIHNARSSWDSVLYSDMKIDWNELKVKHLDRIGILIKAALYEAANELNLINRIA